MEHFYASLGASTLSSLVEETVRIGSPSDKQDAAVKLKAHVLERAKLFLHEHPREGIKHDTRWLEKNLTLQIVSSINLRRSLRGHALTHTEKRSAHLEHDRRRGLWILSLLAGKNEDSYQISQCICKVLLERPSQQSFLTLETFLNLSLYQLRARGYNVERILRAKAAEQRIAEEERKKQFEAEQQELREQEQQWKQQQRSQQQSKVATSARQAQNKVPGGFGSDSDSPPSPELPKTKSRGLFSGLTRRLGLSEESDKTLQNFLGNTPSQPLPDANGPPSYDEVTKPKPSVETEQVSSPHAVQQNLLNAIQSSRAYDSNKLFSPPTTSNIKEQSTYCDSTPSTDINFLADTSNGTRVFVNKHIATPAADFLRDNSSALNEFASMLHEVAEIYNMPRKSIHIFYDESGGTIAFNSNGSVFANFRFFSQLHQKSVVGEGRVEAVSYWWIVCAHELAHNIVKEHNSQHSYYT